MVSSFFSTDDKLLFHTFLQGLDVCLSHLNEQYYEHITNEQYYEQAANLHSLKA